MANTMVQREFLIQLRRAEFAKLHGRASFEKFLAMEPGVVPSKEFHFNRIDDRIPVAVSHHGEVGAPANFTREREKVKLNFYVSKLIEDWVEEWFKSQHGGALPTPIQPRSNNEVAAIVGGLHRQMDKDVWGGNDDISDMPGIKNIDTDPDAISNPLSTVAGRKEFIEAVGSKWQDIKSIMQEEEGGRKHRVTFEGQKVLAVDSSVQHWLAFPYEDNAGGVSGPTVSDMLAKMGVTVLPVETDVMTNTCVLHYKSIENAAWLPATRAVQTKYGFEGDNQTVKIFHLMGTVFYRKEPFGTITGVAS